MRSLVLVLVILVPTLVFSDQWRYPGKLESKEFDFGETKIVRIVDSREDQQYPNFRVDVFTKGELVGRFGGVYFQDIAATKENSVFVGISNIGLPNTAIILFDNRGRIHAIVDHSEKFEYCTRTSTIVRNWYYGEKPSLQFVGADQVSDIQVIGCKGKVISLSEYLK